MRKLTRDDTTHGEYYYLASEVEAQPAQEPVAWMYQCTADNSWPVFLRHRTNWAESGSGLWIETPLYPPLPVQTVQRPWVGLTDEEIHALPGYLEDGVIYRLIRAAEATLRSKNT